MLILYSTKIRSFLYLPPPTSRFFRCQMIMSLIFLYHNHSARLPRAAPASGSAWHMCVTLIGLVRDKNRISPLSGGVLVIRVRAVTCFPVFFRRVPFSFFPSALYLLSMYAPPPPPVKTPPFSSNLPFLQTLPTAPFSSPTPPPRVLPAGPTVCEFFIWCRRLPSYAAGLSSRLSHPLSSLPAPVRS